MVDIIARYKGTVIEFLGDGILAVFGAPIPLENHTESAVAAAITMQNAMSEVNAYCLEKGYETVDMGVGIHSGEVFIGNIGSDKVMRYNVIGRVVNECSRIESYSVGSQVLVSAQALERLTCDYTMKTSIDVKAKGIGTILKVYEISALEGEMACSICEEQEQTAYQARDKIIFELQLIIDKLVGSGAIRTCLKEISSKYAIVSLEDKNIELNLYDDVKILAADVGGRVLFNDVYAKVTDASIDRMKLHFTHTNADFQHLLKQIRDRNGDA